MIFRFLKRGIEKQIKQNLSYIHKNLSDSFSKVKVDINSLLNKITHLEEHTKQTQIHREYLINHHERLEEIENKLVEIIEILSTKKENKTSPKPMKIADVESATKILNGLTETQKKIFISLFKLQKQLKVNSLSTKSLASALYAEKAYPAVRSTISEYTTTLYELGLIFRRRKGKETFIGITNQGAEILKELEAGIKKKKTKKEKIMRSSNYT